LKVYVAGPYSWRDRIKEFILELEVIGIESTASWIYEEASPAATLDQFSDIQNQKTALIDVQDIQRADVIVVFTIDPLGPSMPRGGRHWETGYAYALGKEVVLVGPKENIFSFLPDVIQFSSQELAKTYLYKRSLN
jgi:nucleoside 2-deoxyribosyltransferase